MAQPAGPDGCQLAHPNHDPGFATKHGLDIENHRTKALLQNKQYVTPKADVRPGGKHKHRYENHSTYTLTEYKHEVQVFAVRQRRKRRTVMMKKVLSRSILVLNHPRRHSSTLQQTTSTMTKTPFAHDRRGVYNMPVSMNLSPMLHQILRQRGNARDEATPYPTMRFLTTIKSGEFKGVEWRGLGIGYYEGSGLWIRIRNNYTSCF